MSPTRHTNGGPTSAIGGNTATASVGGSTRLAPEPSRVAVRGRGGQRDREHGGDQPDADRVEQRPVNSADPAVHSSPRPVDRKPLPSVIVAGDFSDNETIHSTGAARRERPCRRTSQPAGLTKAATLRTVAPGRPDTQETDRDRRGEQV